MEEAKWSWCSVDVKDVLHMVRSYSIFYEDEEIIMPRVSMDIYGKVFNDSERISKYRIGDILHVCGSDEESIDDRWTQTDFTITRIDSSGLWGVARAAHYGGLPEDFGKEFS